MNSVFVEEAMGGGANPMGGALIHRRFRHAHHEIKDWLHSLGFQGGSGERVLL